MTLVDLIILVVVLGLIAFVFARVFPLPSNYSWVFTVIQVLIGLVVIVWLFSLIGFHTSYFDFNWGRLK